MKNIVVIEDKNNLLNNGIKIDLEYALVHSPMNIVEAEDWEDRLDKMNIPYVLAEVKMKAFDSENKPKWLTGYVIFLKKDDLSTEFTFVDDPAQDAPKESLEDDTYKVHL